MSPSQLAITRDFLIFLGGFFLLAFLSFNGLSWLLSFWPANSP